LGKKIGSQKTATPAFRKVTSPLPPSVRKANSQEFGRLNQPRSLLIATDAVAAVSHVRQHHTVNRAACRQNQNQSITTGAARTPMGRALM